MAFMTPPPRRVVPLVVATLALASLAAVVVSGNRLGGRRPALLVALGSATFVATAWLTLAAFRSRREDSAGIGDPLDPVMLAEAASRESGRAREHIEKIRDARRREALLGELTKLDESRDADPSLAELEIVVFGTASAGKTSLVNALIGRRVGETGPTMGTTRRGASHVHAVEGVRGVLRLVDAPGLGEAGSEGSDLENEARRLARAADLLLFVVDHDLVRGEHAALMELARLGKRSIIAFNKRDRFPDAELEAILARLRDRLEGIVAPEDVVSVAAAPRPIPVRVERADGSRETVMETPPPDVRALRDRIAKILAAEGPLLRVANLLLRARLLDREATEALDDERRRKCEELIEHYQWKTAAAVFVNPLPALNLVGGVSLQLGLMAELARACDVDPSPSRLRALAAKLGQAMLAAGLPEASASVIAGLFKRSPATFIGGAALQAVTAAYLARIAGEALAEYYQNGEDWGPGGIEGALLRRFESVSRVDFLQSFARLALDHVPGMLGSKP